MRNFEYDLVGDEEAKQEEPQESAELNINDAIEYK